MINPSEIGCQINLITGKHYEKCRGSCHQESRVMTSRITREAMLMQIAEIVALRGTCSRLSVGAVVTKESRIVSQGYVGSPPGMQHCTEWGCDLEGSSLDDVVKGGQRGAHCIRTTHAEMNALLFAARNGIATYGTEMYVTHTPCLTCAKAIITAGVQRVVWGQNYGDIQATKKLLSKAGIRFGTHSTV